MAEIFSKGFQAINKKDFRVEAPVTCHNASNSTAFPFPETVGFHFP
ncbi:MAG: hypothetical protein GY799_03755 [Desulfobulbaceae bacterium]|nr:hypothetical protein [Desulfobulbaceae bacterium]